MVLLAAVPTTGDAQVVQWGNDPLKIGFTTEVGTWYPTSGGSRWSCPFPTVCVPPNSSAAAVRVGYLAYATNVGISAPGLPLNGQVTLNGNAAVGSLLLGTGAQGQLDVNTFALTAKYLVVGNEAARDVRGTLQPGVGTLNVTNGGSVRVEGPSMVALSIGGPVNSATPERAATVGTVNVSGTGTLTTSADAFALLVGAEGSGVLRVTAGGTVTTGSQGIIGWVPGSTGSATVDGAGSSWSAKSLIVGLGGTGDLTISNGGHVSVEGSLPSGSGGINVGGNGTSNGRLVVTGAGSQLSSPSDWGLAVGAGGTSGSGSAAASELVVERGASVTAGTLFIGANEGTATARVDAATVSVTGGLLVSGQGGPNALTVRNGGTVSAATGYVGSQFHGQPASVLVDDATWRTTGQLNIATTLFRDKAGEFLYGTGVVQVRNHGVLQAGGLTVGAGGTLDIDPATIDVAGDFSLAPGGTLAIGVEGAAPGLFSQLRIGGVGLFQGSVFIDFLNGFAPSAGQSFALITAAGGADFSQATIGIRGLSPGFQYSTTYVNGVWSLTSVTDGVALTTPEPGSAALVVSGLAVGFVGVWRRLGRHG